MTTLSSTTNTILIWEPTGQGLDEDTVTFNENWVPTKNVITLWNTLQSETQRQDVRVDTSVTEGRKYTIQAAIVRIMKTRKTAVGQNEIITSVIEQIRHRFSPTIPEITVDI